MRFDTNLNGLRSEVVGPSGTPEMKIERRQKTNDVVVKSPERRQGGKGSFEKKGYGFVSERRAGQDSEARLAGPFRMEACDVRFCGEDQDPGAYVASIMSPKRDAGRDN